jgi:hypothetical protein
MNNIFVGILAFEAREDGVLSLVETYETEAHPNTGGGPLKPGSTT